MEKRSDGSRLELCVSEHFTHSSSGLFFVMLDTMLQEINKWIEEAVKKLGYPIDLIADRWGVEHPDNLAHGDYATNIALILSKHLNKK